MDPIRIKPPTKQPLPTSPHALPMHRSHDAANTPKTGTLDGVLHFGRALNTRAETILEEFGNLGLAASKTLKDIDHLTDASAFLGNGIKVDDALRTGGTGPQGSWLSKIIRKGTTALNATTGIVSIAQASAQDRMSGDNSYSRTIKAVGKSAGQMATGILATAGVTALAPASASVLAVTLVGGAVVTGCTIVSGRVFDYLMEG